MGASPRIGELCGQNQYRSLGAGRDHGIARVGRYFSVVNGHQKLTPPWPSGTDPPRAHGEAGTVSSFGSFRLVGSATRSPCPQVEDDVVAAFYGLDAECGSQVGLAGADRADEHNVRAAGIHAQPARSSTCSGGETGIALGRFQRTCAAVPRDDCVGALPDLAHFGSERRRPS
jgi:hypothetical protein